MSTFAIVTQDLNVQRKPKDRIKGLTTVSNISSKAIL